MSKNNPIRRICLIGMFAALYLALNLVGFRAWSFHVTFASLPVIVGSLLFGPVEGMLIALIGEFFNQVLSYGITVTTVLWLIPPAVRGLVVGGAARLLGKERRLEDRYGLCYAVCAAAALCTTAVNTLAVSIAARLNNGDLALAAAVLTQLGDTLATIAAQRERCGPGEQEI